jgi:hypothetical protein
LSGPGIWGDVYLSGHGGGIYANINYCKFQYASNAIFCDNFNNNIFIKNSSFYKNVTGMHGGQWLMMDSCNFIDNINGLKSINSITANYCNISNNEFGLLYCSSITARNCLIISNQIGLYNTNGSTIKNSIISSNQIGMLNIGGIEIDSCIIRNNHTGILDSLYGYNTIINSSIDSNSFAGIIFNNIQHSSVVNCQIRSNGEGIIENGGTSPNIFTRNIIEGNFIGIRLATKKDNFYCNKICNNSSYDLKYLATSNANIPNNYWCTSDSISTQAKIFDGHDSISLGVVNFMPIDTSMCFQCIYSKINFTWIKPSCLTCIDGTATAYPTNGVPPYSYYWNTTPVQTTQTAIGLSNGYYNVCIADSTGCIVCDSVILYSWWNVNEIKDNFFISLFPNPASDKLKVVLPTSITLMKVEIFNPLGRLEHSSTTTGYNTDINISSLTRGVHLIKIMAGDKIGIRKFIKN